MNFYFPQNKYRNKKTTVDGITFDSKKEAQRYSELKIMLNAGLIKEIILQPKFELIPSYTMPNGKKIRSINYIADFDIYYSDGVREIEDVKGMKTKEFIIKEKMFHYFYPNLKLIVH